MQLIIATNNLNKLDEIKTIFKDLEMEIVFYKDVFGHPFDCIEDRPTLEGNASKKVESLPPMPDRIYLADDSGLEVDALNGAPGIYSARYAGLNATKEQLCKKLLLDMNNHTDRHAQFRTVIALKFPDNSIQLTQGIVSGQIIHDQRGLNGFGYDAVFQPSGHTKTFAEMESNTKNTMSHRFLALEKAHKLLFSM